MTSQNRLAQEANPYLLQHALNPVDWYPWGDDALQKAKAEDKPILLSIGYSECSVRPASWQGNGPSTGRASAPSISNMRRPRGQPPAHLH